MSQNISFIPEEELQPTFVMAALSEQYDWGLVTAGVPDAHKYTKGSGVTIAVLDTGVPSHPDLDDNLIGGLKCTTDPDAVDRQGHATHCAGIACAAENGIGIIGVAPQSKLFAVKVLDDSGRGTYEAIADGIKAAVRHGCDIISMSLGASQRPPLWFHDVVKEAFDAGKILIAAAGNDGGNVNFPAQYDEVIAVAAVDQNGNIAKFSSRGKAIDFAAAGVGVYSTYRNNGYAKLNGTSQACPFISGVAALILSYERANGRDVKNCHEMLKKLASICDSAGRIGNTTPNGALGYGIPSFANAKNLLT
jgi:subtilisin family serine protease